MNKLLHQLANEARIEVSQRIGYTDRDRENAFEEKFAELIVRECAGIAREIGNNTEPDDFALDQCYEIEDQIKQHFGVEE